MKRLMMAALAAGSLAFAVPVLAQTAMPRDSGGSPGNGQASMSTEKDSGGTPGSGQAGVSGEKETGGSPGTGQTEEEKNKD